MVTVDPCRLRTAVVFDSFDDSGQRAGRSIADLEARIESVCIAGIDPNNGRHLVVHGHASAKLRAVGGDGTTWLEIEF